MVDYKSYSNCNSLPELLLPVATFSFIQGCVSGSGQRKILEPNPYKKTYMDPGIKRSGSVLDKRLDPDPDIEK